MVTEIDRDDVERDDAYTPNEREATQNELQKFMTVMRMMDSEYDLNSDTGTMTIVEGLIYTPDLGYVQNHIAALWGLYYNETYSDLTIDVYNCIANPFSASEPPVVPTAHITPLILVLDPCAHGRMNILFISIHAPVKVSVLHQILWLETNGPLW